MNWSRFRATAAAAVFATLLLGSLVATPAAHAVTTITSTSITTPTDLTFFIADNDAVSQTFAISGTTTGSSPGDAVNIRCYNGPSFRPVANNVALNADGSFSVPNADLGTLEDGECRLAAVPAGVTSANLVSYAGPRVGVGERDTDTISGGPNNGKVVDYYLWAQQHEGAFD
jgi:protein involved in polysaccharide export with SLBB domain